MTPEENKRGNVVALAGLAVQTALALLLAIVWLLTGSSAAMMVFLLVVGGIPLWITTAIVFYARHLADVEAMELDELGRSERSSAIFGEELAEMRLAQRRLKWVNRFVLPGTTLLLAGYALAWAFVLGQAVVEGNVRLDAAGEPLHWGFFALGGAFVAFLFSRYALGMAKLPAWRLLRAGGGYLTLASLASAVLAALFFLHHVNVTVLDRAVLYALPAVLGLLGAEWVLNFVMDFYRPRSAGAEQRPSFESRLAGLLSTPGSIAHSIADALNYQFGFEVSGTWFYQLLQKAVVPLILLGVVALLALSMIVIVEPGQRAIVLTWGQLAAADAGEPAPTLEPGIHLKAPWPVQTADVIDVDRIRSLRVGVSDEREQTGEVVNGVHLYLWKQEHGGWQESNLLVARREQAIDSAPQAATLAEPGEAGTPRTQGLNTPRAVGFMRVVLDVHFRVSDPYEYRYRVRDPEALLRDICNQELLEYVATESVDSLLSTQRDTIAADLHRTIAAQAQPLGLEIVTVALQGIHPPPEVAEAFENKIQADRQAEGLRLTARAARQSELAGVAGSSEFAERFAEAIRRRNRLNEQGESDTELAAINELLETMLRQQARGRARSIVNEALAYRWTRANAERGRVIRFQKQLEAYHAAPRFYQLHWQLDVLAEGLADVQKYVLGVPKDRLEIRSPEQRRAVGTGLNVTD